MKGITYVLGSSLFDECRAFDPNFDHTVDAADLIAAVTNLLEGCGIESLESLERRRKENQAKWRAAGIDDYEIDYQRLCFCLPPSDFRIMVRNGEIFAVYDAMTGEEIDLTSPGGTYLFNSVDGVFDIIGAAIAERAATLQVDYHPELGYPERVSIDYVYEIADDEIGIRITALRPLRDGAELSGTTKP